MFVYQKNMFDRYYCILSFCDLNNLEQRFDLGSFLYIYDGAQKHVTFCDVNICDGLESVFSKCLLY